MAGFPDGIVQHGLHKVIQPPWEKENIQHGLYMVLRVTESANGFLGTGNDRSFWRGNYSEYVG